MKKILIISIGLSIILWASFSRSSSGIVTDNLTKLQWQDDYSDNGGVVTKVIWQNAINYCEALTLGGYSDWRLPNINELLSIVDDTKSNPAIDSTFVNTSNYYWSSTTYTQSTSSAWFVNFAYGISGYYKKYYNSSCVRCVR